MVTKSPAWIPRSTLPGCRCCPVTVCRSVETRSDIGLQTLNAPLCLSQQESRFLTWHHRHLPAASAWRQTWKWIQRQANALWSKHQTLAEMRRTGGGAGSANCTCVCTRITSTAIPALNYNAPAVIQSEELLTWSCGSLQCRETHGGKGGSRNNTWLREATWVTQ